MVAIERAHRGEMVLPPEAGDTADVVPFGRWPGDDVGLSARESEVLAMICRGLGNAEIAVLSQISVNTVKTYIRSCYRKIGAETRTQAVIWGRSNGFILRPRRTTIPPRGPHGPSRQGPPAGRTG